ncbi:MAG TPA: TetR/AcrR family transcriptional regulator [Acidimicrobiia bacterium]|nr:TetR/AcrR family transcriptional regulator [Acidimicrobiia bacterium]
MTSVRGRPRSTECDRAILDAAITEYAERGLEGMSVDAVAARAGVSKATIYRRYPSKVELVVAAALMLAEATAPKPDTGSLRGDLLTSLRNLRRLLDDPVLGAATRMLVVDALQHGDLARMHTDFVATRRERTFDAFRRAIERGELRPDVDFEFAADAVVAQLFYQHLVRHESIDDEYLERVVDDFLARYGLEQANAR